MKGLVRGLTSFIVLVILLIGFTIIIKDDETMIFKIYQGRDLNVAIVGEFPHVLESNIHFNQIQLEDLLEIDFSSYDGIFITEDHLRDASNSKYTSIYHKIEKPIFFIGSSSHLPFLYEEIGFDDVTLNDSFYATAIKIIDDQVMYRAYGLYNNDYNQRHIQDAFSRMFESINKDFSTFR